MTAAASKPIDRDGDGEVDEKEREEAEGVAGEAIDGDGDGKLDEEDDEDPRVLKARKGIAKSLDKFEKKQARVDKLKSERDAAFSELVEYNSEHDVDRRLDEGEDIDVNDDAFNYTGKLHDATARVEEAGARMSETEDALVFAAENRKSFDADNPTSDDDSDEDRADREERKAETEAAHAKAVEEHADAKAAAKAADRELAATTKKYESAQRKHEKASEKVDGADDGADELGESMRAYGDTHDQVVADRRDELRAFEAEVFGDSDEATLTPEQEAEHARLTGRYERADKKRSEAASIIEAEPLDDLGEPRDETPQDSRDKAHALITGPKGGQYYINDKGEKEYVNQ